MAHHFNLEKHESMANKFRMTINYDGNTYTSCVTEISKNKTFDEFVDDFCLKLSNLVIFRIGLEDGGLLILPEQALKRCSIVFQVVED